jgi:hypothetical protein
MHVIVLSNEVMWYMTHQKSVLKKTLSYMYGWEGALDEMQLT